MAKKTKSKKQKITTSRIRFTKRHKGFMPGDEAEQTGGIAKTLVQIGVAEFLTRKGVRCKPDGSPMTRREAKAAKDDTPEQGVQPDPRNDEQGGTEPPADSEETPQPEHPDSDAAAPDDAITALPEKTREALNAHGLHTDLCLLKHKETHGTFTNIPGIGKGLAAKIEELIADKPA